MSLGWRNGPCKEYSLGYRFSHFQNPCLNVFLSSNPPLFLCRLKSGPWVVFSGDRSLPAAVSPSPPADQPFSVKRCEVLGISSPSFPCSFQASPRPVPLGKAVLFFHPLILTLLAADLFSRQRLPHPACGKPVKQYRQHIPIQLRNGSLLFCRTRKDDTSE